MCLYLLSVLISVCLVVSVFFFFLRIRRPPISTRTDTLFPYTTLFRSDGAARFGADVRLPNMVYASVRRGPPGGGRLVSADVKAGQALRGVLKIIRKERWIAAPDRKSTRLNSSH